MDTIKAGRPCIDLVKLCYAANRPLLLVGTHGIGKSELLVHAARELNVSCVVRDLSIMEPADLTGLPKARGRTTEYLPPAFLPTTGRGLLVIEELNRAERYMRAPCLQLLTARVLNDYVLPPGWLPVAAVNPADDGNYQVDELDPALASRFTQVLLRPDQKEWLAWARSGGRVHPAVVEYVASDPTAFDQPESSPRSWAYVGDLMHEAERSQASPALLRAAVLGTVGDARGKAFLATLKRIDRPLTAADVLQTYPKHRKRVMQWIVDGRLDLAEATLRAIYLHVQPEANYQAVREDAVQWGNLGSLLTDLPGDLREDAEQVFGERGYILPPVRKTRKEAAK